MATKDEGQYHSSKTRSISPSKRDQTYSQRWKSQSFKAKLSFWVSLIIGFAWLGPIIFLLIWNFNNHIIGGSAWCPSGSCSAIVLYDFSLNETASLIESFDEQNRDVAGGLQYASKALEVWFVFPAGSLVYMIAKIFATQDSGLPLGYLMMFLEFTDLRVLLSPSLWSSPGQPRKRDSEYSDRGKRFWLFAALAFFLCVLSNFMGPATAALLIPTLQWVETPLIPQRKFSRLLASDPPSDGALIGCTGADLAAGNYSCTETGYGQGLDGAYNSLNSSIVQAGLTGRNLTSVGILPAAELGLSFQFNVTLGRREKEGLIPWSYSRQVIRDLAEDYEAYAAILSRPHPTDPSAEFRNSLLLHFQRRGPILASTIQSGIADVSTTIVAEDRQIRCYVEWYSIVWESNPPYTKCVRVGNGWDFAGPISSFSTAGPNETMPNMTTEIYRSNHAAYFTANFTTGEGVPACLPNGTLPASLDCDFDAIFSREPPPGVDPPEFDDFFVMEYSFPNSGSAQFHNVMMFFPLLGFTNYLLDPSPITAAPLQVQTFHLPAIRGDMTGVSLDPTWILAALSTRNGSEILPNRSTTRFLYEANAAINAIKPSTSQEELQFIYPRWIFANAYLISFTGSLIGFDNETIDPGLSWPDAKAQGTDAQPILWKNFRRQVWTYGLNSRASKLGVAVVILGAVVVLLRTALKLMTKIVERTPVELLANALEHEPKGESDEMDKRSLRKLCRERWKVTAGEDEKIVYDRR